MLNAYHDVGIGHDIPFPAVFSVGYFSIGNRNREKRKQDSLLVELS